MTDKQTKRIESFRRRVSVKGAEEIPAHAHTLVHAGQCYENDGLVTIGWERARDGRDMETVIDREGRTVYTRPVYTYR